jgi:hypothetical protein
MTKEILKVLVYCAIAISVAGIFHYIAIIK